MIGNEKVHPVATELFIRGRKVNISRIHHTIILSGTEGCKTKHCTIFHHEDSKQTRASTIAFNHSSDTDSHEFKRLYRRCHVKPYLFLIIDTTLSSDNTLRFCKYLLEGVYRVLIIIDVKIQDEKLQYDMNRVTAKISTLLSGKIDKYEYLTGDEILPHNSIG